MDGNDSVVVSSGIQTISPSVVVVVLDLLEDLFPDSLLRGRHCSVRLTAERQMLR